MNSKVLDTLEYQKIKDQLLPFLSTDQGRQVVKELLPSSDVNVVAKWLDQSADGATIMRLEGEIPIPKLDDISNIIKRLNIEDASLSGTELAAVTKLLRTTQAIYNFFESLKVNEVELRTLNQLVDRLSLQPEVTQQLVSSIAEDGRILDGASRELRSIRAQITRTQAEIRGIMNHFIKGASAKYLSEPIITIRDDRFVLPIKAEYKQSFGGIIHDQSASGQTLYVEPNNVVEKNNQLRRDKLAERVEERRILAELTELLRPIRNEMKFNGNIIGQLDFINAKAKLAHQTHSTEPALSIDNDVNLRQARHPLIDPQMVVANDIAIGSDYRTIIVTGPNTGGKTIMMKTLGLLQLMGQSGMFIPALEHSQIGIFDDIFADIGDDQSIEASLSTFSSHMDNVINILNQATNHSLILLDELGAGTDPKEGAALAMAIIDRVTEIGSELVATTHYPELKAFAYNRPNTINASMEFDFEKLQPTYRFLIGIPGQSNALSIVEKLGLDKQVVSNARDFTDEDSQDINTMIDELTEQTKKARQEADELKVELADATDLHRDLTTAYEKYQANKEQLAEKAREQANQVVEEAKGKADTIIADLRAKQQQVANSPVKENELMDAKGALNSLEVAPQLKKNKVLRREKAKHDFHEGDEVLVKSYGQPGTLVRKMGNHSWEVQIGILKMKLDESDLEKGSAPKPKKAARPRVARTKSAGTSPTLDLRGTAL